MKQSFTVSKFYYPFILATVADYYKETASPHQYILTFNKGVSSLTNIYGYFRYEENTLFLDIKIGEEQLSKISFRNDSNRVSINNLLKSARIENTNNTLKKYIIKRITNVTAIAKDIDNICNKFSWICYDKALFDIIAKAASFTRTRNSKIQSNIDEIEIDNLVIKKAIELLKKSGAVNNIKKNDKPNTYTITYRPNEMSRDYTIKIFKLQNGTVYMNMANNKISMILDINNTDNELSIFVLSYYTTPRDDNNSNEPKLDVLRNILVHCKHVSLDDTSYITCNDNTRIPYQLIAFVDYPRLQLYEGIVETPDIAKEIRSVLSTKGELFANICDINISGLIHKLDILRNNNTTTEKYKETYNKAFNALDNPKTSKQYQLLFTVNSILFP